MEVLGIIKEKAELLPEDVKLNIEAVITHLKVAEEHYNRGRESGDEQFFTDVIYRCNHAFEGVLREAFRVIAEKDPSSKKIYDIEQFFAEDDSFKPRVLDLFTKYRQDWRNPSTHDHKLFFSEGEALLALLNVQAFVAVVLDQLIEKAGYTLGYSKEPVATFAQTGKSLLDRTAHLLQAFSTNEKLWQKLKPHQQAKAYQFYSQILGAIEGFLVSQAPELRVKIEPEIAPRVMPDILVSDGKQNVIVEVKVGTHYKHSGIEQLSYMLTASNEHEGILFLVPTHPTGLQKEVKEIGSSLKVVVLSPLPA